MGRKAGYSKKDYNYRMDSYIEGNVVRVPEREENIPRRKEKARPSVSKGIAAEFEICIFSFYSSCSYCLCVRRVSAASG